MFLRAHITASVQKRHVSVLKSKYSKYWESGLTIKQEIIAKVAAIISTVFLEINPMIFDLINNKLSDFIWGLPRCFVEEFELINTYRSI
jgi:hypothetical protein